LASSVGWIRFAAEIWSMTEESFLVLETGRCSRLVAEGQQGHLLKLMCREESNRHGKNNGCSGRRFPDLWPATQILYFDKFVTAWRCGLYGGKFGGVCFKIIVEFRSSWTSMLLILAFCDHPF